MTDRLYWEDLADTLQFENVLDELGIHITKSRKGGTQHEAHCPLESHPGADNTPSFGINSEKLVWNCFTCDEGGALPSLVMRLEGISEWQEALQWLLPFTDHNPDTDADFLEKITEHFREAEKPPELIRGSTLPRYSTSVLEKLTGAPVALFEQWGIKEQSTIDHFGIRYSPEWMKPKLNYSGPVLIIPHWFGGKLVGYQERWLGDRPKKLPKYTNSTDFPRSETIFNWDNAEREMVVVESTMTVLRLYELGIPALATFGASVSKRQINLLGGLKAVILSFDDDPPYLNEKGVWVRGAGHKARRKVAELLSEQTYVEVVPPSGIDKGDLADLEDTEIQELLGRALPYGSEFPDYK